MQFQLVQNNINKTIIRNLKIQRMDRKIINNLQV